MVLICLIVYKITYLFTLNSLFIFFHPSYTPFINSSFCVFFCYAPEEDPPGLKHCVKITNTLLSSVVVVSLSSLFPY